MSQQVILISEPQEKSLAVKLKERGEREELLGLIIGGKPGKYGLEVLVDHLEGKTFGRVMIRGVALERANIEVEGVIKIREGAQGVDDFLEMRILVVGEMARAMAEPKLEIEANEVKASHAATVGRIDEEQLFYLQSRGVGEKKAEQMLVKGFLDEVVKRIENKGKKKEAEKLIEDIM